MDLLGAYNSDSDSDSDVHTNKTTTAATSSSSTVPKMQQTTETAKENKASHLSATVSAAFKAKQRGKKMLKLSAVLPEHIWNQLTTGGGNGFDSDSSGAEEEDDHETNKKAVEKLKSIHTPLNFSSTTPAATAKDAGLQSLMQELTTSKPAPAPSSMRNSVDSTPASIQEPSAQHSSSLGFAFITSTVETTKRKRSKYDEVRDIHSVAPIPLPDPSQRPAAKLGSSTPESNFPQRPATSSMVMNRPAAPPTTYQHHQSAAPDHAASASNNNPHSTSRGPASNSGGGKKKLSRKRQMEQMLRAGMLDEVQGDHSVEGVASVYQPSEFDSVPPAYNSHGVRMVPTSSYNPSTGSTTASTEITGRQRNKHQLNSLLASAASLEAQRAQNPHLAGRTAGSSHRATAKRKYGW